MLVLIAPASMVRGAPAVDEMVAALGADAFRDRAAASERLRAAIGQIDKQTREWIETAEPDTPPAFDSEHALALYRAVVIASTNDMDPEIGTRAAELLAGAAYSVAFFALGDEQRRVAGLPFQTMVQKNGQSISRRTYFKHGFGVTDLGTLRIVKKGFNCGSGRTARLYLASSGSSSRSGSGATRFHYQNLNGVGTFEWGNDITFTLAIDQLTVGKQKVPLDPHYRVVFLDDKNAIGTVVRLHKSQYIF